MEKRIRIKIDKKGNVSARTIEGFEGENCHEAVDMVLATINGKCVKSGPTDDADRVPDMPAFLTGVN